MDNKAILNQHCGCLSQLAQHRAAKLIKIMHYH